MASKGARVLVIDDEEGILKAVTANLTKHGFQVDSAESGEDGLRLYAGGHPDVILLDLGLPDVDGTEVIRRVREADSTPIIVLSVRGSEREKVEALDLGADDYLTKPFGVDELLARVRVALRHSAKPESGAEATFKAGALEVDFERRRVRASGAEVKLTPTEFELLRAFVANPDKLMTDRMLLHAVWGPQYGEEAHYLHVYMARLRKKVEPDPQRPRYLVTEPGVGYRLVTGTE